MSAAWFYKFIDQDPPEDADYWPDRKTLPEIHYPHFPIDPFSSKVFPETKEKFLKDQKERLSKMNSNNRKVGIENQRAKKMLNMGKRTFDQMNN